MHVGIHIHVYVCMHILRIYTWRNLLMQVWMCTYLKLYTICIYVYGQLINQCIYTYTIHICVYIICVFSMCNYIHMYMALTCLSKPQVSLKHEELEIARAATDMHLALLQGLQPGYSTPPERFTVRSCAAATNWLTTFSNGSATVHGSAWQLLIMGNTWAIHG